MVNGSHVDLNLVDQIRLNNSCRFSELKQKNVRCSRMVGRALSFEAADGAALCVSTAF
jgi:hypothetical protein